MPYLSAHSAELSHNQHHTKKNMELIKKTLLSFEMVQFSLHRQPTVHGELKFGPQARCSHGGATGANRSKKASTCMGTSLGHHLA